MKTCFWAVSAPLLMCAAPAFAEAQLPIYGEWDCGPNAFSLTERHYNDTSRVESIERIADDAYGVTLTDGYRFALFDVTTRTLTWHSPESGDTFECRRIG